MSRWDAYHGLSAGDACRHPSLCTESRTICSLLYKSTQLVNDKCWRHIRVWCGGGWDEAPWTQRNLSSSHHIWLAAINMLMLNQLTWHGLFIWSCYVNKEKRRQLGTHPGTEQAILVKSSLVSRKFFLDLQKHLFFLGFSFFKEMLRKRTSC